eukprot:scaffold4757_cov28-Tisochrysis_lutea.AAC.4
MATEARPLLKSFAEKISVGVLPPEGAATTNWPLSKPTATWLPSNTWYDTILPYCVPNLSSVLLAGWPTGNIIMTVPPETTETVGSRPASVLPVTCKLEPSALSVVCEMVSPSGLESVTCGSGGGVRVGV